MSAPALEDEELKTDLNEAKSESNLHLEQLLKEQLAPY
jgi:hypothetical protein